jgi:hypothetical protein
MTFVVLDVVTSLFSPHDFNPLRGAATPRMPDQALPLGEPTGAHCRWIMRAELFRQDHRFWAAMPMNRGGLEIVNYGAAVTIPLSQP